MPNDLTLIKSVAENVAQFAHLLLVWQCLCLGFVRPVISFLIIFGISSVKIYCFAIDLIIFANRIH